MSVWLWLDRFCFAHMIKTANAWLLLSFWQPQLNPPQLKLQVLISAHRPYGFAQDAEASLGAVHTHCGYILPVLPWAAPDPHLCSLPCPATPAGSTTSEAPGMNRFTLTAFGVVLKFGTKPLISSTSAVLALLWTIICFIILLLTVTTSPTPGPAATTSCK